MREDDEAWSTAGSAATVGPGSDATKRGGRRRGRGPQHWLRSGRVAAAPATMPPEKEAALIMRPPCRVSDSNITSHHPLSSLLLPSFVAGGRGGGTTRREGAPAPVRRGKQRYSWPASPPPSTLLPTGAGGGNDGVEKEQGGRWQYPPHTKLHAVSMQGGSCQIYKQLHAQQSIAKKRTSKLKQTKKKQSTCSNYRETGKKSSPIEELPPWAKSERSRTMIGFADSRPGKNGFWSEMDY